MTDKLKLEKMIIPDGLPEEGTEFPLGENDFIEVVVKSTVLEEVESNRNRNSMRRSGTVKMLNNSMDMGNFPYIPESPRVSGMLKRRETSLLIEESTQSLVKPERASVSSVAQLRENFIEKEALY